ncbi:MAG: metallophosphoesterase [Bacteroidia bacterium]|nr:metallophosphoesterase [Bacteroidia bacterium]
MKSRFLLIVVLSIFFNNAFSQIWPSSLAGRWTFDNLSNLTQAAVGSDLVLHGTHQAVSGPDAGDGAVSIGVGSYYECTHSIAPNGGGTGSYVNEYSLLFDFMVPDISVWHCFYQTNMSNSNDGEVFVNTIGNIGISVTGYSPLSIMRDVWHRLVVTVDMGNSLRYYLDGKLILEGTSQSVDGRYSLDPTVLFFADDNSEDNEIHIAQLAIFNTCLTKNEVFDLGGFRQSNSKPYLQTPTPNSMYVSWLNADTAGSKVQYGITQSLGYQSSGSFENISGNCWHTAKLTGLLPNTTYYYRCISGFDTSEIYPFHTPVASNAASGHIRFAIASDSQCEFYKSKAIADTMKQTLINLYGADWYNSVSFIMHTGDIVQDGSASRSYQVEYFNPFASLSCSVPVMVSIGNHEGNNADYFKYMKYEDFCDYSYPNPVAEKYYSFILGNTQFIALNTSGSYNTIEQATWLENKLNDSDINPDVDFVFTYGHQPGRSEIWPDGNNPYVQSDIYSKLKIFPKVAMYSYGHSHCYERGVIKSDHAQYWDFRVLLTHGGGSFLDRWGMYSNQTNYQEIHRSFDHYSYVIVDIDIADQSYTATMYSLGNEDHPRNNEILDTWHRKINQPAPSTPLTLAPNSNASETTTLIASPFSGIDSVMTSQFQVTTTAGNWSAPIVDAARDYEDIYKDSGAPYYNPVDLNTGIDLARYHVSQGILTIGDTYWWRARYRDQNLRWSNWSAEQQFSVVSSNPDDADFIADITSGVAPLTVHFTDISHDDPVSWQWDFDNDGFTESTVQDPVYTYTQPGLYTVTLTTQFTSQQITETKQSYINVLPTDVNKTDENSSFTVYPNPFSNTLRIQFLVNQEDFFTIEISDINGRSVKKLTDRKMNSGTQIVFWDGNGENGLKVADGIYFCNIRSNHENRHVKILKISD